jgi:hypothetical protein
MPGYPVLRVKMPDMHLGLPNAVGDDHRPVETLSEKVPVRDFLLRAEKLPAVLGWGDAQDAQVKRNVFH